MENHKRLTALWQSLTKNTQLSQFVTPEDREVILRRTEGEGITFLTSKLPLLGKALDLSFQTGKLEPIPGFICKKGCAYPLFLSLAWEVLFEEDGTMRPPLAEYHGAVACIRQLTLIFYKLEQQYTAIQKQATIDSFLAAERDLEEFDYVELSKLWVLRRARTLVCRLLAGVDPQTCIPRHGSGASACGVIPHERYDSFRFIPKLNGVFPYDKFFFFSPTHLSDNLDTLLEAEVYEPAAKVVFVPKDARGPRLISEEPREFMFIQLGLMDLIYNRVDSLPAIAGQIGFTDQTRNREYARIGFITGEYATLDLKEASDRVSWDLVLTLFPENWILALWASRSRGTTLPDGTYVPFRKFAPMGSACCFPVEAICFWAIASAALGSEYRQEDRLFSNRLLPTDFKMSVFGDDIIVPTEKAHVVIEALEACGLLVNRSKSYWSGPFRESCGLDSYLGHDVTPIRVKCYPSDDAPSRDRTCKMFNNIIHKFGISRIGLTMQLLFEEWYGPTPVSNKYDKDGNSTRPGLYLHSTITDVPRQYRKRSRKGNRGETFDNYQITEYRIPVLSAMSFDIALDRWSLVLRKTLLKLRAEPADRIALSKRYRAKYRWVEL